jgi:hypothetical protein
MHGTYNVKYTLNVLECTHNVKNVIPSVDKQHKYSAPDIPFFQIPYQSLFTVYVCMHTSNVEFFDAERIYFCECGYN